jgi:hypothetical protein
VAGADHFYINTQLGYFINLFQHQRAEWEENICIILGCLIHHFIYINLVIKPEIGRYVLPESIIGHKDGIFLHIRKHAVRPMQHRCFDK